MSLIPLHYVEQCTVWDTELLFEWCMTHTNTWGLLQCVGLAQGVTSGAGLVP